MTGMRMKKRIAAVLLSLLTLFSASCGVLEMREADPEPLPVTDRLLEQARKPAEAEAGEQLPGLQLYTLPEEEAVEPVVTFAFAGDILIDTFIITDAARKAGEGQNYSFLRTFSGVYRNLEVADVTVGFDSSATHPKGDSDPTHRTPREALETLSAAGYDVLNTLAWQDEKGLIADCGMEGISTASGGTNAFSAEIKGVNPALRELGRTLGREGVLTRQEGDAVFLAVPLDRDRPFSAMPIFCFGSPETISGRNWIVFRIMDGAPTVNLPAAGAD